MKKKPSLFIIGGPPRVTQGITKRLHTQKSKRGTFFLVFTKGSFKNGTLFTYLTPTTNVQGGPSLRITVGHRK